MDDTHLDADLKLLIDARDELVQDDARVRNRLHAVLLGMAPGCQTISGRDGVAVEEHLERCRSTLR